MNQPDRAMQICLDYSAAAQQQGGIARYSRELLPRLRTAMGNDQLSIFTNNAGRVAIPPDLNGTPYYRVGLSNKAWRVRVALDYLLDRDLDRHFSQVDLFLAADHLLPRFKHIPSLLNIHDLSYLLQPHYHNVPSRLFQQLMMPHFARHANHIVVPSLATRRDLITHYHIDAQDITVIPEGVGAPFRLAVTAERQLAVRNAYHLPHAYVLYVGTLEPRKNIIGLLDAYAALLQEGLDRQIDLVLAGGLGWLYRPTLDHLAVLGLNERVHLLGHVPEADLPALYAAAELFAFPSWYEGFGLPPLEAMACGTPVVVSNAAALPEVVGSAGLLVAPANTRGWVEALRTVLTRPALHARLVAAGRLQAAPFTWERTAAATLDLCRQVINAHRA